MGCDGGSIPTRSELVKTKKKEERPDRTNHVRQTWFYCALSKERLRAPIVADALGRIYNKEAMIRFLLDRKGAFRDGERICAHIESFKDLVDLKLADNPGYVASASGASALTTGTKGDEVLVPMWACPITMREMNGKYPFLYLSPCGHVFSDQALKQVPSQSCLVCSTPFTIDDTIPINPTEQADIDRLQARMERISRDRETAEAEKRERKRRDKEAKKAAKEGGKEKPEKDTELAGDSGLGTSGGSGSDEDHARAERKRDSKKRKRERAAGDSESDGEGLGKKQATVNMRLPKLDSVVPAVKELKEKSEAIRSLYGNGKVEQHNMFFRGTFHR